MAHAGDDQDPFLVCFGCRHRFTASNLQPLYVPRTIRTQTEEVSTKIQQLKAAVPDEDRQLHAIEEALCSLVTQVETELRSKDQQIELWMRDQKDLYDRLRRAEQEIAEWSKKAQQDRTRRRHLLTRQPSNLNANGTQVQGEVPYPPTEAAGRSLPAAGEGILRKGRLPRETDGPKYNRFGAVVARGIYPEPPQDAKSTPVQFEFIPAAIYLIFEAMTGILHADMAVLWHLNESRDELTTAMVIGRHFVKPIKLPTTTGLAGAVACTGVAVNVSSLEAEEDIFNENIGKEARDVLCVPLIRKFGGKPEAIGCVQLINKNGGTCRFGEHDEMLAHSAAVLVSTVLSVFPKALAKYDTQVYDPSLIASAAGYGPISISDLVPPEVQSHVHTQRIFRTVQSGGFIVKSDLQKTTDQVNPEGKMKEVVGIVETLEASLKQKIMDIIGVERALNDSAREVSALRKRVLQLQKSLAVFETPDATACLLPPSPVGSPPQGAKTGPRLTLASLVSKLSTDGT